MNTKSGYWRLSLCPILVLLCLNLLLLSCGHEKTSQGPEPKTKQQEEKPKEEKLIATGWIQNPHTEYLHTVIGFRTTDNRLLNLIFLGVHQQLSDGMYCRITFHRLTGNNYLPEFIQKVKLDYFILDGVELLPLPDEKSQNQKKED